MVKKYRIFGKYEVEVWVDETGDLARVIKTHKSISTMHDPHGGEKYLKNIRDGKIKPLESLEVKI